MPDPNPLPPPDPLPKNSPWIERKQDGALSLDVMKWIIPRHMRGKSGKPIGSYVTQLGEPFWRSTMANPHYRCPCSGGGAHSTVALPFPSGAKLHLSYNREWRLPRA